MCALARVQDVEGNDDLKSNFPRTFCAVLEKWSVSSVVFFFALSPAPSLVRFAQKLFPPKKAEGGKCDACVEIKMASAHPTGVKECAKPFVSCSLFLPAFGFAVSCPSGEWSAKMLLQIIRMRFPLSCALSLSLYLCYAHPNGFGRLGPGFFGFSTYTKANALRKRILGK